MINKKLLRQWCLGALALLSFCACTENIDTSNRYVFTEETVLSYLEKHEAYSMYVDLLKIVPISPVSETTVAQLLSARGSYTCFAPNNEAIQIYLDTLAAQGFASAPNWDGFTNERVKDSIQKVIVYNSLLDGGDAFENYKQTVDFPIADNDAETVEFDLPNLGDRKLNVKRDKKTGSYLISNSRMSQIQCDILVTNGVIHQMEDVIAPSDISARNYLADIVNSWRESGEYDLAKTHGQLVLARIIEACGLYDTLSVVRDEVYEMKQLRGEIPYIPSMTAVGFAEGREAHAPAHRKIGFTIFSEGDEYWRSQGIDPTDPDLLQTMIRWIKDNKQYSVDDRFSEGTDYKSEGNLLYQWITYHILPMRIPTNMLIIHDNELGYSSSQPKNYTIPVYEYYTTMGPRRLLKIFESKESKGIFLNRFPILNNGRSEDGHERACLPEKTGCYIMKDSADLNAMNNCIIYPIDKPLSYNDATRDNLSKDRLRFDGMSLFPEAMTNDIRRNKQGSGSDLYRWVHIPPTSVYPYFENMYLSDETIFVYYNTYENWCNLYEDEMKAVGHFEVMVKLPPVPRDGEYELRYCVLANGNRGVVQPYFGHDLNNLPVTGIPMDLTMNAKNSNDALLMGWKDDTGDEDLDAEIDHQMRNNGFMKGSKSITDRGSTKPSERDNGHHENSRRILTRQKMYANRTYYLRLKTVLQAERQEFYMDYMELCPKAVFDNPEDPEDIW